MKKVSLQIISGAQTGADRAALDAALAYGVPCGGWVPKGRVSEDGLIPAHYPVQELEAGGYKQRTIQNLKEADGTLIFYFGFLEGGTEQTVAHCIKLRRPYLLIDGQEICADRAAERALDFIRLRGLTSLNVAGPRASKHADAYPYAFAVVSALLSKLGFTHPA